MHAYNQPDPQTVLHRKTKHGQFEKAYRIPLLSYYQVIAITGVQETLSAVLVSSAMEVYVCGGATLMRIVPWHSHVT